MEKYLTYEEYTSYGGTLPEDAFTLAEFKAQKRIDYLTDSRVEKMAKVPEEVKLCIMTLIRVNAKIGADAQADSPMIASFNTDGYSESYGSIAEQADAMKKAADQTICEMLYGVLNDEGIPLLYRGLDV